jgi:hypothetical protein
MALMPTVALLCAGPTDVECLVLSGAPTVIDSMIGPGARFRHQFGASAGCRAVPSCSRARV